MYLRGKFVGSRQITVAFHKYAPNQEHVLRIFSGEFKPGEIAGKPMTQEISLGIAALFVIPIVMVVLTLNLDQSIDRWANIVVAVVFLLFNAAGVPTYPGWYDKFLIVVSLVFNAVTIWRAWNWN